MKRALSFSRTALLWLTIVGMVAAIVYGFCCLIVREISHRVPSAAAGHTYVYEMHPQRGGKIDVYVKPSFHWTSEISRVLAIGCIGFVATTLLVALFGGTMRLLIPGGLEVANFELARYRQAVGPNGVTAEGLRYVAAWRDMRRRGGVGLSLLAGGLALLAGAWAIELDWNPSYLAAAWFSLLIISLIWASLFRCPRCGNRFSSKAGEDESTNFCTHCGLPTDSPPTAQVSPAFVEWKKRR